MANFVVDEDMQRSAGGVLEKLGHTVIDVRDVGLRGRPDEAILQFAQEKRAALITGDVGFSRFANFVPSGHFGIVIVRFPSELSTDLMNVELAKGLRDLTDRDYRNTVIVISPGMVRIRRRK